MAKSFQKFLKNFSEHQGPANNAVDIWFKKEMTNFCKTEILQFESLKIIDRFLVIRPHLNK